MYHDFLHEQVVTLQLSIFTWYLLHNLGSHSLVTQQNEVSSFVTFNNYKRRWSVVELASKIKIEYFSRKYSIFVSTVR